MKSVTEWMRDPVALLNDLPDVCAENFIREIQRDALEEAAKVADGHYGTRNGGDRRSDGGWETMIGRAIRALIEGGKEEK